MIRQPKREEFEPHMGTTFQVWPAGMETVTIELMEVKDKSTTALDSFSLLFRGSMDSAFRHNTHMVRHPVMGEMELFIGPVHTGKTDAVYYQAIFSAPK
jgi:hypothetical protein